MMGIEEGTCWNEHWVLYGNQFDNKLYLKKFFNFYPLPTSKITLTFLGIVTAVPHFLLPKSMLGFLQRGPIGYVYIQTDLLFFLKKWLLGILESGKYKMCILGPKTQDPEGTMVQMETEGSPLNFFLLGRLIYLFY